MVDVFHECPGVRHGIDDVLDAASDALPEAMPGRGVASIPVDLLRGLVAAASHHRDQGGAKAAAMSLLLLPLRFLVLPEELVPSRARVANEDRPLRSPRPARMRDGAELETVVVVLRRRGARAQVINPRAEEWCWAKGPLKRCRGTHTPNPSHLTSPHIHAAGPPPAAAPQPQVWAPPWAPPDRRRSGSMSPMGPGGPSSARRPRCRSPGRRGRRTVRCAASRR